MYIFLQLMTTGETLYPEQAHFLQRLEVCRLLVSIENPAEILTVLRILLTGRNSSSETQGQIVGTRKSLNGQKQVFWHQSEAGRTAATVWNWSGKTLSPGALLGVVYFSSCHIFFCPFRLFLVPTICPWVSEDGRNSNTAQHS